MREPRRCPGDAWRDEAIHFYSSVERVNDCETPAAGIYCRASTVAVVVAGGGLIQTARGRAGGSGGLRTKRSG